MDPPLSFDSSTYLAWAMPFLAELDSAICRIRQSVEDKEKAGTLTMSDLCELEDKLKQRFQLMDAPADAVERVALSRRVLVLAKSTNSDSNTADVTLRLAAALHDLYLSSESGAPEAQAWSDETLSLSREAVSSFEPGDPNAPIATCILGTALRWRYARLRNVQDLEDAIAHHNSATDTKYASHPLLYEFMSELSRSYLEQHFQTLDLASAERAYRIQRQATEMCSNQNSRQHAAFQRYAHVTYRLAEATKSTSLAHETLNLFQELEVFSRTIKRPFHDLLGHIASSCLLLADLANDPQFWNKTIAYAQEGLTSANDSDRALCYSQLAVAAGCLFRSQGDVSYINISVDALEACLRLKNLTTHYRIGFGLNLGASYGSRYEAFGHREDLDNAIKRYRDVLNLPNPNAELVVVASSNLSLSLVCRFDAGGNVDDLEEALGLAEKAMNATPSDNTHRPNTLAHMAEVLLRRYQVARARPYIEKAIAVLKECIQIENVQRAYRSDRLLSLSRMMLLCWRDVDGDESDVDTAIQLAYDALALRQLGHPRRHEALNALSNALSIRFNQHYVHSDYFAAIEHQKEAVNISPPGSTSRPQALFGLAKLHLLPDAPCFDATAAMKLCTEAIKHNSSTAYLCLQDAIDIQPALESVARLPSFSLDNRRQLLEIYRGMVDLLPQVAYFGLDAPARLRVLKSAESLATTAAAHAILLGQPEAAVEILEQGRGVFWSQGLKLRSQFNELPADLRDRLITTAYQLERAMYQTPQDDSSKEKAEMEELDRKIRRLSDDFQGLVKQARDLPGHGRFLLPLDFAILLTAAQRGPIVVFLTSEILCCAIIMRYGGPLQVVKLDDIPSHLYEIADASLRDASLRNQQDEDDFGRRSNSSAIEPLLEHIWTAVMQPVTKALNIEPSHGRSRPRVWLCPSGRLTLLPLHAARTCGNGGLGCSDYFITSYTPTIDSLLQARSGMRLLPRSETKVLLVDVPIPFQGCKLPETTREMAAVRDIVPKAQLVSLESKPEKDNTNRGGPTVNTIFRAIPDTSILHIASHGIQKRNNALESGFAMQDGMLTLSKLMSLNLPKAFLAILSACNTAKGDSSHPDQILHLAAAMLFVGFRSVIGTMWSMHDMDGPSVSRELYSQLFAGRSDSIEPDDVAYALDSAVQMLRQSGLPANRWAPYVHIGI